MSKNIIVTGAGKGIGLELVKEFANSNHNVIAISRNISKLQAQKYNNVQVLKFDLLKFEEYPSLLLNIQEHFKTVDILINNAGLLINKKFQSLLLNEVQNIFSTNVLAPFKLIQMLEPFFTNSAHIVNIGSIGGVSGSVKFPGLSAYSASKGALTILTECLATELTNAKINCMALGATQTEMLESAFPGYQAPLSATEISKYIAWFALNGANYHNGKVIEVALSTP
jgi:short-subunit dehydrogenase